MMIKDLDVYQELTTDERSAVVGGNYSIAAGGCVLETPYFPQLPSPGDLTILEGLEMKHPIYEGPLPGVVL